MQNFSKISLKATTSCPHWQLLVLTRAMQIKSAFQALMKWRTKEKNTFGTKYQTTAWVWVFIGVFSVYFLPDHRLRYGL